ncbi:MAG TPA: ankyrin repeat domain-containing protein [Ferruginibacter sp.]|nr:ankyrin repeat domain-containing protein [Ferruginibacter sp.]
MSRLEEIIIQIELHSAEGINNCFANGVSPNDLFRNEPLFYELISEYTRSPRFKDCVKVFIDHGLDFEDPVLLSVLCDDAGSLQLQLTNEPEVVFKKYSLQCAYTPVYEATLLHICAEFNHVACAQVLVQHGADINARAGIDENGFGGQTPVFHTVNQNGDQSAGMMNYLLSLSADLRITVAGLIWGKGYDWETLIPAVNPISYAMMGSLPQMHRDEITVAKVVATLLKHEFGIDYTPGNIPCKYLNS